MAVKPRKTPSTTTSNSKPAAKIAALKARPPNHPPASSTGSLTAKAAIAQPHVALVLQGGGALGAYQAGVYQALHEHNLTPDWVVGTSIGAINAAIIAGNPREKRLQRLKEFWDRVGQPDALDMQKIPDTTRQLNIWLATMETYVRGVQGFFAPRQLNPFALGLSV